MENIPDCRYEYENDEKEPKVAFECSWCGECIYIGDDYYDIGDIKMCCECNDECKSVAEEGF